MLYSECSKLTTSQEERVVKFFTALFLFINGKGENEHDRK